MLPRLEAQSQIDAIVAAQLAQPVSGATDFEVQAQIEQRQEIMERLKATARGEAPPQRRQLGPEDLAGMGIAVSTEEGPEAVIGDLDSWLGNGASAPSQEPLSDG
ncbi:MAG: hypothetical protein MUF47_00970 [Porphyrobacter sp.]|jgi:hypothetical protein|nr:hypothetical protein [Porphyrobacter sp.]